MGGSGVAGVFWSFRHVIFVDLSFWVLRGFGCGSISPLSLAGGPGSLGFGVIR